MPTDTPTPPRDWATEAKSMTRKERVAAMFAAVKSSEEGREDKQEALDAIKFLLFPTSSVSIPPPGQ